MRGEGASGARSAIPPQPPFLPSAQHRVGLLFSPGRPQGAPGWEGAQWSRRQLQPELNLASDLALMQIRFFG